MEYTKGKWGIVIEYDLSIITGADDEYLGNFINESHALLALSAVNACISINPNNPLAVADNIVKVVEALKLSNITLNNIKDKGGFSEGSIGMLWCRKAIAHNDEALSAIQEKEGK
jgi:hypothetical protein